jgi:hypothetical protein
VATKAERDQAAKNDEVLRGTPSGHNPPSLERTRDEVAADNAKVLAGKTKDQKTGSETEGNIPSGTARPPEV